MVNIGGIPKVSIAGMQAPRAISGFRNLMGVVVAAFFVLVLGVSCARKPQNTDTNPLPQGHSGIVLTPDQARLNGIPASVDLSKPTNALFEAAANQTGRLATDIAKATMDDNGDFKYGKDLKDGTYAGILVVPPAKPAESRETPKPAEQKPSTKEQCKTAHGLVEPSKATCEPVVKLPDPVTPEVASGPILDSPQNAYTVKMGAEIRITFITNNAGTIPADGKAVVGLDNTAKVVLEGSQSAAVTVTEVYRSPNGIIVTVSPTKALQFSKSEKSLSFKLKLVMAQGENKALLKEVDLVVTKSRRGTARGGKRDRVEVQKPKPSGRANILENMGKQL